MGCGRRENQGREDVRYDVWGEPGKEMAQVGYLIKYWVVPPEMRCSNRRAGSQPASSQQPALTPQKRTVTHSRPTHPTCEFLLACPFITKRWNLCYARVYGDSVRYI